MSRLLLVAVLLGGISLPALPDDQAKPAAPEESGSVKPERRTRIRLGGVMVGVGYSRYSRPFYGYPYYSPAYWGGFGPYYSPFWDLYLPMYYPGFYPPFYSLHSGPDMGEVRLRALPRGAEVYLNGAYAGKAEDLKTFWLKPGAYDVEVRADNRTPFNRRIYVLSGKTLKLEPTLEGQEAKP